MLKYGIIGISYTITIEDLAVIIRWLIPQEMVLLTAGTAAATYINGIAPMMMGRFLSLRNWWHYLLRKILMCSILLQCLLILLAIGTQYRSADDIAEILTGGAIWIINMSMIVMFQTWIMYRTGSAAWARLGANLIYLSLLLCPAAAARFHPLSWGMLERTDRYSEAGFPIVVSVAAEIAVMVALVRYGCRRSRKG